MLMGHDQPEMSPATLIPEFSSELIARIIPGLVAIIILIYSISGDFPMAHSTIGLEVFKSVILLVAAWIVGLTLDVGVFAVGVFAKERLKWKWLKKAVGEDLPPARALEVTRELDDWERKLLSKHVALRIFFRNMAVVSALTGLTCLVMLFRPGWHFHLPAFG